MSTKQSKTVRGKGSYHTKDRKRWRKTYVKKEKIICKKAEKRIVKINPLPEEIMKILEAGMSNGLVNLSSKNIDDELMSDICHHFKKLPGYISQLHTTSFNQECINTYSLSSNHITSKGASKLFKSFERSDSLIFLNLRRNELDDKCINHLVKLLKKNHTITRIDFDHNNITDKGIHLLSKHVTPTTSLRYLRISHNKNITDDAVPFLFQLAENSKVHEIDIKYTSITAPNILFMPLAKNILKYQFEKLDFSQSDITDNDITRLCKMMKDLGCSKLKVINLFDNLITSKGAALLFDTLRSCNTSVSTIDLSGNRLDDECMKSLGELIKSKKSVDYIKIGHNLISDTGISVLAPYLFGQKTYMVLDISKNERITDSSTKKLIEMIEKSQILDLNIDETSIAAQHVLNVSFIRSLVNQTIDKIDYYGRELTDDQLIQICELMRRHGCDKIREINLWGNKITSHGATNLFDTLKESNSVTTLTLYGNSISDECMQSLGELLRKNNSIEVVDIGDYRNEGNITDKGIEVLAPYVIGNISLKTLAIYNREGITGNSTELFKEMAQRSCLREINLFGTSISDQDQDDINKILQTPAEERGAYHNL